MSTSYISVSLRREVTERAKDQYEYCLIPSFAYPYPFHVDHVISEKQGGLTIIENLAFACPMCNFAKGTDISAYIISTEEIVDLYNPRKDEWSHHFELQANGFLKPLSISGQGTIRLLKLNDPNKVQERKSLLIHGYPF